MLEKKVVDKLKAEHPMVQFPRLTGKMPSEGMLQEVNTALLTFTPPSQKPIYHFNSNS